MSEYCSLHAHNHDSLLDGVGTQEQHAARAAELGQGALAETNHGVLSGSLDHIRACHKYGIVPLMGVEAYFRPNRLERNKGEKAYHHLLIAKDIHGWHNLIRLTTIAWTHQSQGGGFYGKPCIDWELAEKYSEGLICTTACVGSYLSHLVQQGFDIECANYLRRLKSIYKDDLFLEIQPHDLDLQREYNIAIARLAHDHSLPIVATGDVHYPFEGWGSTQQIAKMISTQTSFKKLEEDAKKRAEGKMRRDDTADTAAAERRRQGEDVFTKQIDTLYLMSGDEMRESFAKWHPHLDEALVDQALSNTHLVASRCVPFVIDKSVKAPKITSGPKEAEEILRKWTDESLDERERQFIEEHAPYTDPDSQQKICEFQDKYRDRVEYELEVLRNRGVFDFFVLFTRWLKWMISDEPLPGDEGKKEPIEIGDGRGSVGGSLVAYLLGFTTVDPIAYGLSFPRFLNPDRKGLPDIDQDIDVLRREVAKEWFVRTQGSEYVAEVGTFRDFLPKNTTADVARAFDVPRSVTLELNKTYDVTVVSEETTLEQIKGVNPKLQKFASDYPKVYAEMLRLEGQKAGSGRHAAGVVVADRPLIDFLPRHKPPNVPGDVPWRLVTSWTGAARYNAIDDIGLMKIDALGVRPPTKRAYARKLIRKHYEEEPNFNLPAFRDPYAVDPEVMEMFCRGETTGIFQFATPIMTHLVKQIQPDNIFDLAACNALVRPGADKVKEEYGRRKRNPDLIEYWTPELEPVLKSNYGLMIYQEDAMEIVQKLGGFTPGQADDMRKAMGKYYRLGKAEAQRFMQRYWEQWKSGTRERGISDSVRDFGWAKILEMGGYAFNKSHAVLYAMTAYRMMDLKKNYPDAFYAAELTYENKEDTRLDAINEAKAKGVSILAPDVGYSEQGFCLSPDGIHFGYEAIKGIGEKAATKLSVVKYNWGSMDDFYEEFPKNVVQALEEAGALDKFGGRKGWDDDTKAALERQRIGMALSGAPVTERWGDLIESREYWVSKSEYEGLEAGPKWPKNRNEGRICIGGEIISIDTLKVKTGKNKGRPWARFKIAYGPDIFRCVMFSDTFDKLGELLVERPAAVLIHGRKSGDDPDAELIVDEMASVVAVERQLGKAA